MLACAPEVRNQGFGAGFSVRSPRHDLPRGTGNSCLEPMGLPETSGVDRTVKKGCCDRSVPLLVGVGVLFDPRRAKSSQK